MVKKLVRVQLIWGCFVQFPIPKMDLQSASRGFSRVGQTEGQLSQNFLSWDFVHSGAPSGLDV